MLKTLHLRLNFILREDVPLDYFEEKIAEIIHGAVCYDDDVEDYLLERQEDE